MSDNHLLLFVESLGGSRVFVPEGSILWGIAFEIIEMVTAYRKDTITFFEKGDCVNALAAAYYACGWSDGGVVMGLITSPPSHPDLIQPFHLPAPFCDALGKKTKKYRNMLSEAIISLETAPDPGSKLYVASLRFLCVVVCALRYGDFFFNRQMIELSLGWYSYGHAWADVGVRCGLFRIKSGRSLFSV